MKSGLIAIVAFIAMVSAVSLGAFTNKSNQKSDLLKKIVLSQNNTISISSEITSQSVNKAETELAELDMLRGSADYPIYIVLNSPGGSVFDGLLFIEYAKSYKNVHTVVIFAASMAAMIVESLPGDRYVTSNGVLMFHRAAGSFQGQFETGEVESQLRLWKAIIRKEETVVASRLGLDLKDYKEKILDQWWLHGSENVDSKVADAVVDLSCDDALSLATETVTEETMLGPNVTKISRCPLIPGQIPEKGE